MAFNVHHDYVIIVIQNIASRSVNKISISTDPKSFSVVGVFEIA